MPIYKEEGKKDGKQKYRVRINYRDSSGKARQIDRVAYGATEAKTLERVLIAEIKQAPPASEKKTVSSLLEEFIASKKNQIRETSLDKVRRNLEFHVIPSLGELTLKKLTKPVLQNWKNEISDKGLAVTTCNNIYRDLNGLLNYAVKMEYLPQNNLKILGGFRDAMFTKPEEKIQYYTPEQFLRYIKAAEEMCSTVAERGYYVFFAIAYYTGMRKGEINALKWSDIDGNILHVRRSVSQKVKGVSITETPPKNRTSYRDLQMPAPLISILDKHKEEQQAAPRWTEDFRICGGIGCLSDTSIAKKNIDFAAAANLPVIRIHDFRHSHASLLANEGINIQEVARRLGHSNVEITWKTYAHLYPREEERAVSVLDKVKIV